MPKLIDQLHARGRQANLLRYRISARPSDPADDHAFAEALQRSGHVTLLVTRQIGRRRWLPEIAVAPLPMFADHAQLGDRSASTTITRMRSGACPTQCRRSESRVPSFAARCRESQGRAGRIFHARLFDRYSASIPTISAERRSGWPIRAAQSPARMCIIGADSPKSSAINISFPGTGKLVGAYVHVIGAETLKSGTPVDLGWIPAVPLRPSRLARWRCRQTRPAIPQGLLLAVACWACCSLPVPARSKADLRRHHSGTFRADRSSEPSWSGGAIRSAGLVNPLSNLPNLNALRGNRDGRKQALIAARMLNYEEVVGDACRRQRAPARRADRRPG